MPNDDPVDPADSQAPILLRAAGTAVLLDRRGPGIPQVLHWGADLGPLEPGELLELVDALRMGVARNTADQPIRLTLLPGEPDGWVGRPGLSGHRDGAAVFPRFHVTALTTTPERTGGTELLIKAVDDVDGLGLTCTLRLEASGLLRIRHQITNLPGRGVYSVEGLTALLPVPDAAGELLDLTGRWCRERSPQRQPFHQGGRFRESRRGRTGHDATLLLTAGTEGFGFRHGQVWAVHAAWSGNHLHFAERLPGGAGGGGDRVIGAGELLLPGEIRLGPGASYSSPWIVFAWSDQGMDGVSRRLHQFLRARPEHPRRPRPLMLNTWEAVYFKHDHETLAGLAEDAAAIGVERFVLDDGWFLGRRDDKAGLGDWYVDPVVWPDGLEPLADRVRELGMEFGLWVEPEMVNPDSRLVREHPDWVLAAADRWPVLSRNQLVIDVANPDVFGYLLERLDALVTDLGVSYLKWDHNRDLLESVHAGTAGVHAQTTALYRLLDELRARHPDLEIESCSSGGARVDLGILEHLDRVWASDTNDPLERQPIQRWTSSLIPLELIGSHIGAPVSHTTGRTSDLSFRCATALFAHAGIEWDISSCTEAERAQLTAWAGLYKELRPLLHSGDLVRADSVEQGSWLHAVVAADRSEAVYSYVRLETSPSAVGGRIRLPGLNPQARYELIRRDEIGPLALIETRSPDWWLNGRVTARGSVFEEVGLPAPLLNPGQAVVLHLRAESAV